MSRMNSRTYIVRSSMRAPLSFFALRTPIRWPYFQTACFGAKRMFGFVRSGIFIFGIWPPSSSSSISEAIAYRASTALFDAAGSAFFLFVIEVLLRLVVVDLAFFLRIGRGSFLPFELPVVQSPISRQGFCPDDEPRVDSAHVDLRLVVLCLVEPFQSEAHRGFRNAVDPLEFPRNLTVLADLCRLRFERLRLKAAREEHVEVQLFSRGGEVVRSNRDGVPLVLFVVGDPLVHPDDAHDLCDRRIQNRDFLVHDLRGLLRDPREDALDDFELLLRLRSVSFLREVGLEAPAALLQGEVEFRGNFLDWRHGLLRLGSERDLRRAEVDQDDGGPEGDPLAAPLLEAVAAPVDRRDGVRQGATAGLVQEGHAICEAQHLDGLVRRQVPSVHNSDFDLERVARIDRRVSSHRRCVELGSEVSQDVFQPSLDEPLPDRTEAVRWRGHELRGLHRFLKSLRLLEGQGPRFRLRIEAGGHAYFLRDARGDARELFPEERGKLVRLRLLHHLHEASELNSVRVRRGFVRLLRGGPRCPFVYRGLLLPRPLGGSGGRGCDC